MGAALTHGLFFKRGALYSGNLAKMELPFPDPLSHVVLSSSWLTEEFAQGLEGEREAVAINLGRSLGLVPGSRLSSFSPTPHPASFTDC